MPHHQLLKWNFHMAKGTKLSDLRQHTRYWVQDGAVAVPRSSSAIIGRIIDISRKGIAVRYRGETDWLNGASQLDIMLIEDDYYLSKLSAKIVSDDEYTFYASGGMKEEKRCGLQFMNLSDFQLTEIDQFIHKCTVGRVWSYQAF